MQRTSAEYVTWVSNAQRDGYGHGETASVALWELSNGLKVTHWIWYIFPQIFLGSSDVSERFSVRTCADLEALLDNESIRTNLTEAFALAAGHLSGEVTIASIFRLDARKVRSSVTLFAGYLDRHPRSDCTLLDQSAKRLLAASDSLGVCTKTVAFLSTC